MPDYEPVKRVETPDKFTVKVTYKRLYSPAFGSWAMGMLPEHLLSAQKLAQEAKSKGKDPKDVQRTRQRVQPETHRHGSVHLQGMALG